MSLIPFKPEREAVPMAGRKVYVYRLVVEYPPGSLEWGWEPPGWDRRRLLVGKVPFRWPVNRLCFTSATAKRRAGLFRKYGADVTIERSAPVTWPGATADGTVTGVE